MSSAAEKESAAEEECAPREPGELEGEEDDAEEESIRDANPGSAPGDRPESAAAKILVSGLDEEVTEEDLRRFFSAFGSVTEVTLPRGPYTARARGFAYLTFSQESSAEMAAGAGDGMELLDHKMKVRRVGEGQEDELEVMAQDRKRKESSSNSSAAAAAAGSSNGGHNQPRKRRRRRHNRQPRRSPSPATAESSSRSLLVPNAAWPANRKLYVAGLSPATTLESLRAHFSRWGDIDDAVVMPGRGFGFVTYSSPSMLDACQSDRPHRVDGVRVDTRRAIPKVEMDNCEGSLVTNRLFVGELKREVEDEDLREYFGRYGRVLKVELIRCRRTGRKRGFGYVQFEDYDIVDKIICSGDHLILGKRCNIEKAVEPGSAYVSK